MPGKEQPAALKRVLLESDLCGFFPASCLLCDLGKFPHLGFICKMGLMWNFWCNNAYTILSTVPSTSKVFGKRESVSENISWMKKWSEWAMTLSKSQGHLMHMGRRWPMERDSWQHGFVCATSHQSRWLEDQSFYLLANSGKAKPVVLINPCSSLLCSCWTQLRRWRNQPLTSDSL